MKDFVAELVRKSSSQVEGKNILREYLQARILGALQRVGAMIPLAFHGGTALRFLFTLPRYSEDLDFALERDGGDYDMKKYLRAVQREFTREGYKLTLTINDKKTVQSAFIRFPGLLYDTGLSPHPDEVLAVKIEVDTNPPDGAKLETTIVRHYMLLQLQHHDKASLLAGKLHSIILRPWIKGRDIYDLMWYLSDPNWPEPNLTMLNNALQQTGWSEKPLTERNWRMVIRQYLNTIDWTTAINDLRPFLEPSENIDLVTRDNIFELLD